MEEGVFHLTVYLVVRFDTATLQTLQLRVCEGGGRGPCKPPLVCHKSLFCDIYCCYTFFSFKK